MLDAGFYNMDCMDALKEFPDKFFDLAIVDPPYGIQIAKHKGGTVVGGAADHSAGKRKVYGASKRMLCSQNFTIPLTIAVHRTKVTLMSWNVLANSALYGAGILCSNTWAMRVA